MRHDVNDRWPPRCVLFALLGLAAPGWALEPVRVPLAQGLTIVTAIAQPGGDYESIKTVDALDAQSVGIRYSAEFPVDDGLDLGDPSPYRSCREIATEHWICQVRVHRTVRRIDLKAADHYLRVFDPPPAVAETVPGTTAVSVSTAVLAGLRSGRPVELTSYIGSFDAAPITSADSTEGAVIDPREKGTIRRVEAGAVAVRVVYDGRLTDLPAVHARGTLGIDDAEFWILDDPDNPLVLRYVIAKDELTVVRINSPPGGSGSGGGAGGAGGASGASGVGAGAGAGTAGDTRRSAAASGGASGDGSLEQALTQDGHVDVYGIYFSFNSDAIRPESEPTLKEIAGVLARHPDWTLKVDGHTDSIGGAAFNLGLSNRRAAAVRKALVDRYRVAGNRLVPEGYGLSRPKASNDTLAGRALNRRVELVRR